MQDNLLLALELSLLGMALVFGAILVLWLVMALLVRFTSARSIQPAGQSDEVRLKEKAALAAVVAALAKQSQSEPQSFPLPETALVSAWQAVRRANLLRHGGRWR